MNHLAIKEVEDLATMFDSLARIAEKWDIEISLIITFRKGKGSVKVNGKGKGLLDHHLHIVWFHSIKLVRLLGHLD